MSPKSSLAGIRNPPRVHLKHLLLGKLPLLHAGLRGVESHDAAQVFDVEPALDHSRQFWICHGQPGGSGDLGARHCQTQRRPERSPYRASLARGRSPRGYPRVRPDFRAAATEAPASAAPPQGGSPAGTGRRPRPRDARVTRQQARSGHGRHSHRAAMATAQRRCPAWSYRQPAAATLRQTRLRLASGDSVTATSHARTGAAAMGVGAER